MSNREPLISVVLPTFNGARHLPQAIESCLNQTWTNLELIIVDDSSTDQTPEIIRRYATSDQRVRSMRHETNRKLPAALNSGFAKSSGAYVTWTSDDNSFRPEALERMTLFLSENENVDIVYAGYSRMAEEGATQSRGLLLPAHYLGYRGNVITPCFLFRRAVYDSVNGYPEDLFLAEDYFFWLCTAARFNFVALPDDLYCYREHARSLTSQRTDAVRVVTRRALERALDRIDKSHHSLRAGIMIHLSTLWLYFREPKRARKLFLSAILTAPLQVFRRTKKGMMIALVFGSRLRPRPASSKAKTGEARAIHARVGSSSSEQ
jgi:glycosyltransferase involved in cell wall biosynthesis